MGRARALSATPIGAINTTGGTRHRVSRSRDTMIQEGSVDLLQPPIVSRVS